MFSYQSTPVLNGFIPVPNEKQATKQVRDEHFDYSRCQYITDGPNPSAGQPNLLANAQSCAEGTSPCFLQVLNFFNISRTFTSTQVTIITNTFRGSVAVQAGFNLIGTGSVTTTATYQFAIATSHSTSTAITNSTTFTVTDTVQQQPGTNAYFTCTPTFNCWGHRGLPDKGYLEFCNPALKPDGKNV